MLTAHASCVQAMLLRRLPWDEDQRVMLEDAAPAEVFVAAKVRWV